MKQGKKIKTQLLFIHGGMTFKNRRDYLNFLQNKEISLEKKKYWIEDVEKKMGNTLEMIRPRMPLQDNARYEDWEIFFRRYLPYLRKNAILVGSSLGGIFLAKYLSENKLARRPLSVYLICPPYNNDIPGEDLVGGFRLKSDLSLLEKSCKHLHLWFSSDDEVVPLSQMDKYMKKIKKADFQVFDKVNGHFKIEKFPEFIKAIKKDLQKV